MVSLTSVTRARSRDPVCGLGRAGKGFSDHVVNFLLQRFESKEEKVRIGTLNIFKHIINTSGARA